MTAAWARRLRVTGVVVTAAICAAGVAAGGPMSSAVAGGAAVCAPSPDGGAVTAGYPLPNDGPVPVTITHVALADPAGLSLGESYVVPVVEAADGTMNALGIGGPFPPVGLGLLRPAWDQRVDAVGAQVPPGTRRVPVAELRPEPGVRAGSAPGVDIVYTDAGRTHRATVSIAVTIRVGTTSCMAN